MSKAQQEKLGDLIWEQTGSTPVPDHPGRPTFELLSLPAPPHVDVESAVKRYILELPATGRVKRNAGGPLQVAFGNSKEQFLLEASLASRPVIQLSGEVKGAIDWSPEEARRLLSKALTWWE